MAVDYQVVPDVLRNRDPSRRGRPQSSPLTRDLLAGKTVFIRGNKKTWGNLYKLAKNNGKKAHTKVIEKNGVDGTLVWFEEPEDKE